MNMPQPLSTTLEITSRCNLECKYCFAGSGGKNTNEVSYEVIENVINDLITIGNQHFLIMGGEPTLHRDFLRIITYLKKKGVSVGFSSNGLNLSDSFCKELFTIGVRHNVYVSLDTIMPIDYKEITGRDRFQRVVDGIDNLRNNGIRYAISCVVIKQNVSMLDKLYQFACEHGASFLNLIRFNVEGRGVASKDEMGVNISSFNTECERLIAEHGGFKGFWGENCIIPTNASRKSHMNFPQENDLRQFLTIRSNGDVLMGRASGGLIIGNVFRDTILDMWSGAIAQRYFSMNAVDFNKLILNNIKEQNKGLL